MKKSAFIIKSCFLFIICLCFSNCKKNVEPPIDKSNIVLYDKPLSVIQECIQGKWKLQYSIGGDILVMKVPAKYNQYMNLKPNHIKIGNDSDGVVVDTIIYWKRTIDVSHDRTYLLTYYHAASYGTFAIS